MKNVLSVFALALSLALATPAMAAKTRTLTAQEAMKELRLSLFGQSSMKGFDRGFACEVQLIDLESVFGGLMVQHLDGADNETSVSISSSQDTVVKTVDGYNTRYEITSSFDGSKSEIVLETYEDISDLNVTLKTKRRKVSCFFQE